MNHKRWILAAGLAVILLGAAGAALAWSNRPLGPVLALQPPPASATPTTRPLPTRPPAASGSTPVAPAATATIQPTEVGRTCGHSGSMRLLVIGLTTPTAGEQLGADAIRLVTIDFDRPAAAIVTLPALLWVKTPALTQQGVRAIQLSLVYTRAYAAAEGDPEGIRTQKATQAVAQTILDNFGYAADHYITVDEGAFIHYVDALGGIEVDLPAAVDGRHEGYGIYPAGVQTLDGTHALNFARLFHPRGTNIPDVWGNLERQNLVVRGILAATLKPANWVRLPGLMNEIHAALTTDLSLSQMLDLACMAGKVGESTRLAAVGQEMVQINGLGRMVPDAAKISELIAAAEAR